MAHSLNIEKATLKNKNYRKVLITAPNMQVVVMSLKPEEEIGMEIHKKTDQFIRIEAGEAMSIVSGKRKKLKDGDIIVIPKGHYHNIINLSKKDDLKLYTIYTPPHHTITCVQKKKESKEC